MSKPIVKLIIFVGKRAIAIGIPRNDVLPITPPSCKEWLGNFFLVIGTIFIKKKRKLIEKKAIKEDLIRSIFIPALSNKPITLIGIPYFMSRVDIFSDNLGFLLPIKKPSKINGNILINNLVIALKSKSVLKFYIEL